MFFRRSVAKEDDDVIQPPEALSHLALAMAALTGARNKDGSARKHRGHRGMDRITDGSALMDPVIATTRRSNRYSSKRSRGLRDPSRRSKKQRVKPSTGRTHPSRRMSVPRYHSNATYSGGGNFESLFASYQTHEEPVANYKPMTADEAKDKQFAEYKEAWLKEDPTTEAQQASELEWTSTVFNNIRSKASCRMLAGFSGAGLKTTHAKCKGHKGHSDRLTDTEEDMCVYHFVVKRYIQGLFHIKNFIRLPYMQILDKKGHDMTEVIGAIRQRTEGADDEDPWANGLVRWTNLYRWVESNLGGMTYSVRNNLDHLWKFNQQRANTEAQIEYAGLGRQVAADQLFSVFRHWDVLLIDKLFTTPESLSPAEVELTTSIVNNMVLADTTTSALMNRDFEREITVKNMEATELATRKAMGSLIRDPNTYPHVLSKTFRNIERFDMTTDTDEGRSSDNIFWKKLTGGCNSFFVHTAPWFWRSRTETDVNPIITDNRSTEKIVLDRTAKADHQHPMFGTKDELPHQGVLPMTNLYLMHTKNVHTFSRQVIYGNSDAAFKRYGKIKSDADIGLNVFGGQQTLPEGKLAWGYTPPKHVSDMSQPVIDLFKRPPGRSQAPQLPLGLSINEVHQYNLNKYHSMKSILEQYQSSGTVSDQIAAKDAIIDEALKDQLIIDEGDVLELLLRDPYFWDTQLSNMTHQKKNTTSKLRGLYESLKRFLIIDGCRYDEKLGGHQSLKDGIIPTTAKLDTRVFYEPEIALPFSSWAQIPEGSANTTEYQKYIDQREWGGMLQCGWVACPPTFIVTGVDAELKDLLVSDIKSKDPSVKYPNAFCFANYEHGESMNGDAILGNLVEDTKEKPLCNSVTHRKGHPDLFEVNLTDPSLYERAFGDVLTCPRRIRRMTIREAIETYFGGTPRFMKWMTDMESKFPFAFPSVPEEHWDHLFLGDLWCHNEFEAQEEDMYLRRWVLYRTLMKSNARNTQTEDLAPLYAPYPFSLYYGCHYYPKGRERALKWMMDNFKINAACSNVDSVHALNESTYRGEGGGVMEGPSFTRRDAKGQPVQSMTYGFTILYLMIMRQIPLKCKTQMKNPKDFQSNKDFVNYRPVFDSTERKFPQSTLFLYDTFQLNTRNKVFDQGYTNKEDTETKLQEFDSNLKGGSIAEGVETLEKLLIETPCIGDQTNDITSVKEKMIHMLGSAAEGNILTQDIGNDRLGKLHQFGEAVETAFVNAKQNNRGQSLQTMLLNKGDEWNIDKDSPFLQVRTDKHKNVS